ncbi:hypothetical protein [Streptomyces sp. NPDC054787]
MPKKAETGSTTIDLLDYLFGPGERDEHVDPHLVAAWDPDLPCPARTPARMTLADLALLLDAPVEALRGPKPEEHVWHISVRNHADDRVLSDAEWSEVAAAMVHAAGIAARGDEQACRWIAVRHADDHIHIVATLARQDGRHPRVRGDIPAMHAAARVFEARWGLTPMSPLDRTLPGDRADGGSRPVWFAGSTLAYDLSLPRVRERFEPFVTPADWALAEHRIREASVLLGRAGQDEGAGDVAALGDLLAVAAAHSPALVRDRVQAAADAFEQAARAPGARSLEGRARAG